MHHDDVVALLLSTLGLAVQAYSSLINHLESKRSPRRNSESKMATLNGPNLAKDQDEEEPPAKRPRLHESIPPTASLESLNADCLFTILSFLHYEDLNCVAICSRRYRRARAHESLDQTRSGTITVAANWTMSDFQNEAIQRGWDRIFQGNRTKLIIQGIGRLWSHLLPQQDAVIPGVTSLVLSDPNPVGARLPVLDQHLLRLFPNVVQVKFLHTGIPGAWRAPVLLMAVQCGRLQERPNLQKIAWIGCKPHMRSDGKEVQYAPDHFQLYIDGCDLRLPRTKRELYSDHTNYENVYLFHLCPRLERLSIKNAITFSGGNILSGDVPVPQDMIIKMVRRHPGLRWLRSDLSDENVAMLQQERPDITFVTD